MLEIRNKRMVITRKVHECFGCLEEIEKGKSAVYVSAKEDEQYKSFHLHEECNKTISRDKWCPEGTQGTVTDFGYDDGKNEEWLKDDMSNL